jgi:hypothetical protein
MPNTDYENRFRDPAFVEVWQRWQDARSVWREAWKGIAFKCFPEEHGVYDPDPSLIPEGPGRSAAQEFIDARAAYKAKLAEYPTETECPKPEDRVSAREARECGLSRLVPDASGCVSDPIGIWQSQPDGSYLLVRRHVYQGDSR